MSLCFLPWIIVAAVVLPGFAPAQAPPPPLSSQRPPSIESLPRPPVPHDPLELVAGDAQPVQTVEERAAVISFLSTARSLSNVRAQPYDLKTTFVSAGSSTSDGSWSLEDISPSRTIYRWTAQGPSYSALYLYRDKLLSSNQPAEAIPLRLTQVREAIFFIYPWTDRYTSLRTATGHLNGLEVRCVLVSQTNGRAPFTGGRNWEESEYCIDPASGLLVTYSPAPGLYVHYDYASAVRFHDTMIPGAFSISEAARIVIEARTESVTDPVSPSSSLFNPAGLNPLGVGSIMGPAAMVRSFIGAPFQQGTAPMVQVIVLHGIVMPDGRLGEIEILATTDPGLDQTAVDRANKMYGRPFGRQPQPGTTPPSREIIFTFLIAGAA